MIKNTLQAKFIQFFLFSYFEFSKRTPRKFNFHTKFLNSVAWNKKNSSPSTCESYRICIIWQKVVEKSTKTRRFGRPIGMMRTFCSENLSDCHRNDILNKHLSLVPVFLIPWRLFDFPFLPDWTRVPPILSVGFLFLMQPRRIQWIRASRCGNGDPAMPPAYSFGFSFSLFLSIIWLLFFLVFALSLVYIARISNAACNHRFSPWPPFTPNVSPFSHSRIFAFGAKHEFATINITGRSINVKLATNYSPCVLVRRVWYSRELGWFAWPYDFTLSYPPRSSPLSPRPISGSLKLALGCFAKTLHLSSPVRFYQEPSVAWTQLTTTTTTMTSTGFVGLYILLHL